MAFLGIADPAGARRREHGQRPTLTTYPSNKFTLAFQKRKAASYRHVKNKVDTCGEGEAMSAALCRNALGILFNLCCLTEAFQCGRQSSTRLD